MATVGAIAVRRAEAVQRVSAATKTLEERLHLDVPAYQYTARDPQLYQAQWLEDIALTLEAIVAATAPEERTAVEQTAPEKEATPRGGKR